MTDARTEKLNFKREKREKRERGEREREREREEREREREEGLCLVQRAVLLYDDVDDWASRWNAAGYIYYVAEEAGWAKLKLGSEVEGEREKRSSAWACTSGKGFWKE